jgi:hypothetical protein
MYAHLSDTGRQFIVAHVGFPNGTFSVPFLLSDNRGTTMPALIAYLVCISLFLSGGYFGLNFLAGNFDEPRSTVLLQNKAQRAKETHKNKLSQMQDARAEVAQASLDNSSAQSVAQGNEAYAEAKTAVIDQDGLSTGTSSQNQTAQLKPSVIDVAPQQAAVLVEQNASREFDSHPRTAANDVRDQETSSSPSVVQKAGDANDLADIAQKAKTTQTVTTTGLTLRPMTTSINSLLKRRSDNSNRKVRTKSRPKRALVKMVLQTIEYPDGHRKQQLVSQRRASLEN